MNPNQLRVELDMPPPVAECFARLGPGARVVGGAVRDRLLGCENVRDWDFATPLLPPELLARFPDHDAFDERFGTLTLRRQRFGITVATYRRDGAYADGRHPDRVEFVADRAVDALRRDFTINALYADADGFIDDPVGGLTDLHARRLRAIGDPEIRLREDPLRVLRGVRFGARFELEIDPPTRAAMVGLAALVLRIAAPRRFVELDAALRCRGRALRWLVELGLLAVVDPDLQAVAALRSADALDRLPRDAAPALRWGAALWPIPDPSGVLLRLQAPRGLRREVVALVTAARRWFDGPAEATRRRPRHAATRSDPLELLRAVDPPALEHSGASAPRSEAPLITGRDVLALGVPPGPSVGQILDVANRDIPAGLGRADALAWLARIVGAHIKDSADPADRG